MSVRQTLIGNLRVDDIFHAEYPNGASCVCLVLSANNATVRARRMTTQENLEFDRGTGIERLNDGQTQAVINSVAPLPPEIRHVFLALDRKYGQLGAKNWDKSDLAHFKLTEGEKKALLFVGTHYAANQLPPPES